MKWSLLFSLAFRNIFRNKKRNFISSVAIIAGVFALIFGEGLVDGIDESVIRGQETVLGGHVLLRPTDYPTDGRNYPLKKTIIPDEELLNFLRSDEVAAWTTRLYFRTRLIKGSDSLRIKTIGYDRKKEASVFTQKDWQIQGQWPEKSQQIAIGHSFASLMELNIGDQVILEARSRPGAINALDYTITGIVNAHNGGVDAFTAWMPLTEVDTFIQTEGARSHIALRLANGRAMAEEVAQSLQHNDWTAATAISEVADLMEINKFRRKAFSFISLILMAIAATGIANTIIMAAYERVAEIGTLRAMGMQQREILFLFIIEGAFLGIFAGLVGSILSSLLNYYLSIYGIDISQQAEAIGEMAIPTSMYTQFSVAQILYAMSFGVLVSLLASIWPATHAVQINPADAVRGD